MAHEFPGSPPAPLPSGEGRLELPFSLGRRGRDEGWAAIVCLLFAAGCADLRWHKDGADAAALERDLGECQQQARAQAARESWSPWLAGSPVIGVDAQGRANLSQPGRLDTDRFLREHDLARACMRGRGYELVPAEKR